MACKKKQGRVLFIQYGEYVPLNGGTLWTSVILC